MAPTNNSLTLYRRTFSTYSSGFFALPSFNIQTLERPWIPGDEWRGGKPNHSCIPFGTYNIEPHSSNKFGEVWALVNHDLGVYHYPAERRYTTDRSAILIHVANYVHQLQGCITPGLGSQISWGLDDHEDDVIIPMVTNSRDALGLLAEHIDNYDTITIKAL
jgi:hypothetical protein